MNKISVDGKRFVDEHGRQRIFNGVNYCDKGGNYESLNSTTGYLYDSDQFKANIKKFRKWGFNVVRLGVTWSSIEPEAGKYNEQYVDKIVEFLDYSHKNGIYVFIDLHQDVWGGNAHGDGAPQWATLTKGKKLKYNNKIWAMEYFIGKGVHNAFEAFWNDEKVNGIGLQTYFCNMWAHIAERVKDCPALLGFDLFNEPHNGVDGGNTFRTLILNAVKTGLTDKRCNKPWMIKQLLTGNAIKVLDPFCDPDLYRKAISVGEQFMRKFDAEKYYPFLNRVTKAIRDVTPNGIIMYESCYFTNIGLPYTAPAVTYNGERVENQCFVPHGYDILTDTPDSASLSDSRTWAIFEQKARDQERLNVPVLIGEWGAYGQTEKFYKHLEFLMEKFDEQQWSQAYFAYQPHFGWFKKFHILDYIVRPAPVAVCGDIDYYRHDRKNNTFTLEFTQNREFDVPTVIFAHKEIESIETDGEYKIVPIEDSMNSHIEIKTGIGNHKVIVKFK